MPATQLFIKPDEGKFLALAVLDMLEVLKESSQDPKTPWTPETRKDLKEMIQAGTGLKIKLQKLGFNMSDLEQYRPGDENEFLTKES